MTISVDGYKELEQEHHCSKSVLSNLVMRQKQMQEAMEKEGLRPGMLGYCSIGYDGKAYMWVETTPIIKRIINFLCIFGEFHEYESICLDDV